VFPFVQSKENTMTQSENKYFDLHIQGIGYLNRVREVMPSRSDPFWATDIAAIFGSADNVQKTRFDCRVVGTEAQRVIAHAKKHVDANKKVLVAFKLGDLYAETFTFEKGEKAGATGVSLKARLLRIDWVKVDGQTVYLAPKSNPQTGADSANTQATADSVAPTLPAEVSLDRDDPEFAQKIARLKASGYHFDSESKMWKQVQAA
jgi:hypothetical protein